MILGSMVTGDKGGKVYPGSGPPMEVIPYVLLDYIDCMEITGLIYLEIEYLNTR